MNDYGLSHHIWPQNPNAIGTIVGDFNICEPEEGRFNVWNQTFTDGDTEKSALFQSKDDAEARADFWSILSDFIHRHHNEIRVQLCVPKEDSFPIPLKYIDAIRSTNTDLDAAQEKRIDAIGMSTETEICQILGRVSQDLHC